MINDFTSIKDYFRFVGAQQFAYKEGLRPFPLRKGLLEKLGGVFVKPVMQSGDYILKNVRNPLFLTAIVVSALALTTLIFYPTVFSGIFSIAPAIRLSAYILTQSTILGLCLRTLGRLNNLPLMQAWKNQELQPIPIGTIIISNEHNTY